MQKKARKEHRIVRTNSTEDSRYKGTDISDGRKCKGLIEISEMLAHIKIKNRTQRI